MARTYDSVLNFPTGSLGSRWTLCEHDGCPGETTPASTSCFAHLDADSRSDYLARVAQGEERLTLAGLTVSGEILTRILAAMPQSPANPSGQPRPVVPAAAFFTEVTFTDLVDMQHVTFSQPCSFVKAHFDHGAQFNGARFERGLDLRGATALEAARFDHTIVEGSALCASFHAPLLTWVYGTIRGDLDLSWTEGRSIWLSYATIDGDLKLTGARISGDGVSGFARLDGIVVDGAADLSEALLPYETTISGYADLPASRIQGKLSLRDSALGDPELGGRHLLRDVDLGQTDLTGTTFYGRVSFRGGHAVRRFEASRLNVKRGATPAPGDGNEALFPVTALDLTDLNLEGGARLADCSVEGSMAFQCSTLTPEVEAIAVSATEDIDITSTTFPYAPLDLAAGGKIRFARCLFQRGGVVACDSPDVSFRECDARQPLTVAPRGGLARVTSLELSNVENFVLSGVDISKLDFAPATNVEDLRMQGISTFPRAPSRIGLGRRIIYDEAAVRARQSKRWSAVRSDAPDRGDFATVATAYRALRKSLEDSKDEPGAADFYYGEMEMRRLGAPRLSAERALLSLYRWCSGYGLRASRAFAALGVVLLVGAALLQFVGFHHHERYGRSLLFALESSISLLKEPGASLTAAGEVLQVVLRLLGPLLLALALLGLRARVKR